MHHLLIPAIELGVAGVAWAWARSKGREPAQTVSWSENWATGMPMHEVRRKVARHMSGLACNALNSTAITDVYRRGNPLVTRVPCERELGWHEIPAIVATAFGDINSKTFLHYKVQAAPTVKFSPEGIEFFARQARKEFDGIVAMLNPPDPRPNSSFGHDLSLLGLKVGATWVEVQSAFRTISMQFHPDRMVGLPAHLVELGSKRFNEASAAYQRLRGQLGSQI
ncbi:MAG: DnaJ family molecular chaperone [Phycisphaerales bacterium JB065]